LKTYGNEEHFFVIFAKKASFRASIFQILPSDVDILHYHLPLYWLWLKLTH